MNCKQVQELLPLFVGRDLEKERAMLVTTHLRSCTQCARSAGEYSEANQLLQLFEPPQFSEATYTAVRSRVLREIERESSAPRSIFAFEFLRRSFEPRARWAVSTALLIAVCAFAYYFIANRTNGQRYEQANAGRNRDNLNASPSPPSKGVKPDPTGNAGERGPRPDSPTGVPGSRLLATSSPRSRFRLMARTRRQSQREEGQSSVAVTSAQYSAVAPKGDPLKASVTSDKTLRLEIQTSDRNIRIIWFSHLHTNEGSPIESSKGI